MTMVSITLFSHAKRIVVLFGACIILLGCGTNPPGDPPLSPELISALKQDYVDHNFTAPPDNAFTNKAYSFYYDFWDGQHLTIGHGYALNTAEVRFSGIAILRWDIDLDSKADEVMNYYFQIDTLAQKVPISSAYRNPTHNDEIPNSSSTSKHMWGRAIDFDGYSDEENQNIKNASIQAGASYTIVHFGHCHAEW